MESHYPDLDFGRTELAGVMRQIYDELIELTLTDAFKAMHAELMSLPKTKRMDFVYGVVCQPEERAKRGVVAADGILFQTSAFGDRRPTLFVIKKFLPERYHGAWENLNITFDNPHDDASVSRDPAMAWRAPLPIGVQSAAMASGIELDSLPIVS